MRERFTQEELSYLHALAKPLLQNGELPHNWVAMIATSASQYQRNNLITKLRDMTLPQRLALADAIERAARTQTAVTL